MLNSVFVFVGKDFVEPATFGARGFLAAVTAFKAFEFRLVA